MQRYTWVMRSDTRTVETPNPPGLDIQLVHLHSTVPGHYVDPCTVAPGLIVNIIKTENRETTVVDTAATAAL